MMELVKRFFRLSSNQMFEFQRIIKENMPPTADITVDGTCNTFFQNRPFTDITVLENGSLVIDLYTLERPLLEKLWDFVSDMVSDDDQSFTSQDFHSSDLKFDSDSTKHDTMSDGSEDEAASNASYHNGYTSRQSLENMDINREDHNLERTDDSGDEVDPQVFYSDSGDSPNSEELHYQISESSPTYHYNSRANNGYSDDYVMNGNSHEASEMDIHSNSDF